MPAEMVKNAIQQARQSRLSSWRASIVLLVNSARVGDQFAVLLGS
jgi:hypothetical protein